MAAVTSRANQQFLACNHVTWRPCWWWIQKNFFCRRIFSSQKREMLLFLTTNTPPTWPPWRHVQTSNSVNAYPICDSLLQRPARRSFSPLQKSHRNHCSCVWTEALYGMVLVPAKRLSGIVWTWPYSHILAKRYGMISFIFDSNTRDTQWHSNNQQVKQTISKVCTVHVFSTWSLRSLQKFQRTQRPL